MMSGRSCRIVANAKGTPGIECLRCGWVSWNRNDINQDCCGNCKTPHELTPPSLPANERLDDEQEKEANARAAEVNRRLKQHYPQMNKHANRALNEPNRQQKIIWLRRMAQPLKSVMQGLAACHEGCAHCCHTPVLISHAEAEVIAKQTDRTITSPTAYMIDANLDYVGIPCPFLVGDRCSIYASRPFACRVHYNMDRDESRCVLEPGKPKIVPYFDRRQFDMFYVTALGTDDVRYADIRDFFPRSLSISHALSPSS